MQPTTIYSKTRRLVGALALLLPLGGAAQDTLTLVFAGDVMQHQGQLDAARTAGGYDYSECFAAVEPYIAAADVAVANLETTLAGPPYSGYPQFAAPDALAEALRDAGFDILLTANNHTCDKGRRGIVGTLDALDTLGMAHTGSFRTQAERDSLYPMIFEKKNFRLAVLNYTYGTNGLQVPFPTLVNQIDTVQIAADVVAARSHAPDIIVATMHWGDEYRTEPNVEQQRLADFLVRQGVRLVIGAHPHVMQRMERRYAADRSTHAVVIYSLGNYISNMRAKNTDGGAMAHIRLVKRGAQVDIDECAYQLVWTYKPLDAGRRRFRLLPVADVEAAPWAFGAPDDFATMAAFARRMRDVIGSASTGFVERKGKEQ
jgi:poly-gamma-glutamate synthesis protein (capsule biosynthesis protein)